MERWYDFHGFGCHLGNVGYDSCVVGVAATFAATDDPVQGLLIDGVLLAVERWYEFSEFGGYLGNVG